MKQEIFKGLTKKGERWYKLLLTAKETHILKPFFSELEC